MKLIIEDHCLRCGVCVETCPELFEMDGESSVMKVKFDEVPQKLEEGAQKAVESCAMAAIVIL